MPNDFTDLNALAERLLDFQYYWETIGKPFEWNFTRQISPTSSPNSAPKKTLVNF
jgi:hypothetical protein